VGLVACAALLLVAVGGVSDQVWLSLAFMAAPGVLGVLWRPEPEAAPSLLALWGLAVVLAVSVSGGLAGPLGVFCVAPVVAGLALGASWRVGLGLSLAAAVIVVGLGLAHIPPPPPVEPTRTWLTLMALVITAGAIVGALVIARRGADAQQEALEAELAAFQTLMGDLPELALALNPQGVTEAVFGQPLAGLDSERLHEGLAAVAASADRPGIDAAVAEALAHGAAQTVFAAEGTGQRIAASLQRTGLGGVTVILRPAPPLSPDAASPEVTRQISDAEAARREAELGRERAEANANARTRFLANMSHELRTPLNAIMGFSDMMRMKVFGELPPKYAEYAELIHESGAHLLDLVNDVLDMSKIDSHRYTLDREVFDAREALNAAIRLIRLQADDAGVRLRAVLPPEPLMVDADKRALKQMALNLLSNAVKFTPRDGTIILTAHAEGGAFELIVADTGMGIADADLKRIGQPFEQAGDVAHRSLGTGLGLALVEAFAKLHGGGLVLESRLGQGTAATARMPILLGTTAPAALTTVDAPLEASSVERPQDIAPEPEPEPAPAVIQSAVEPVKAEVEVPPEPASFAQLEPETVSPPAEFAPTTENGAMVGAAIKGGHGGPRGLGPLDARAVVHDGLRQSVLSIFRGPGSRPLPETDPLPPTPPANPPHGGNGAIQVSG